MFQPSRAALLLSLGVCCVLKQWSLVYPMQEAVQDKFDRASERTEDATQDAKQQMNKQQGRSEAN
jgi:hypothetical protein